MRRQIKSAGAFTLVELLVVIGIIVILIALLLPLVIAAKRQGVQVVCASNLRQLGMAMQLYTDEYKTFPAATFISPNGGANGGDVACWPVRLRKFLAGNQRVFYCPAQDSRCEWKPGGPGVMEFAQEIHTHFGYELYERLLINVPLTSNPTLTGTFFSYGYNVAGAYAPGDPLEGRGLGEANYEFLGSQPFLVHYGRSKRRSEIKNASEMIALADTTANGKEDFYIFPRNTSTEPGTENVIANIHGGGANILFCDGHVQRHRQADVTFKWPPVAEDAGKQRMWNADNAASRP